MMQRPSDPEQIYAWLVQWNWVLSLIAVLAGFIWGGVRFGLSVFAGAGLVAINIWLMERVVKKAFLVQVPTKATVRKVILKYFIRFFITALLIAALIMFRIVVPIGLLIGVLVIAVSLFVVTGIEIGRQVLKKA